MRGNQISKIWETIHMMQLEINEMKGELVKLNYIPKSDREILNEFYTEEEYEKMLTNHSFRKIKILEYLKKNPNTAYKPTELSRKLKYMSIQKINRALRSLVREGRVIHTRPYYIISEKELNKNGQIRREPNKKQKSTRKSKKVSRG